MMKFLYTRQKFENMEEGEIEKNQKKSKNRIRCLSIGYTQYLFLGNGLQAVFLTQVPKTSWTTST